MGIPHARREAAVKNRDAVEAKLSPEQLTSSHWYASFPIGRFDVQYSRANRNGLDYAVRHRRHALRD
jgi:hypothetical protein